MDKQGSGGDKHHVRRLARASIIRADIGIQYFYIKTTRRLKYFVADIMGNDGVQRRTRLHQICSDVNHAVMLSEAHLPALI